MHSLYNIIYTKCNDFFNWTKIFNMKQTPGFYINNGGKFMASTKQKLVEWIMEEARVIALKFGSCRVLGSYF